MMVIRMVYAPGRVLILDLPRTCQDHKDITVGSRLAFLLFSSIQYQGKSSRSDTFFSAIPPGRVPVSFTAAFLSFTLAPDTLRQSPHTR